MKISSKLLLSFGFINLLILLSSTLVYYRLTQINQAQLTAHLRNQYGAPPRP